MTVKIVIDAPDELGRELAPMQNRLVEVLERGLRELMADTNQAGHDERQIMATLAGQSTPEEILALRPSTILQERTSQLLARNAEAGLSITVDNQPKIIWPSHARSATKPREPISPRSIRKPENSLHSSIRALSAGVSTLCSLIAIPPDRPQSAA